MKLLKQSSFIMFGVNLAAKLVTSGYLTRKESGTNMGSVDMDSITHNSSNVPVNAYLQTEDSNKDPRSNAHHEGDARHDQDELRKNQARLHVGANHKTKEMEEHGRGTFP